NADKPAAALQYSVTFFKRFSAHRIQHEIKILQHFREILFTVIDDAVSAERSDEFVIFIARCCRYIAADAIGNLDGHASDTASPGMDEHFIAFLDMADFHQALPSCKP